ncbi:DUF58 domain-containing protein [Propionicicella superfundia]|uniref:DUF58 domain-containing protein n=1 Tax=Propionicicella superfundia TaxID=348582 RepID=UPI00041D8CD0|nr:DUF58 domain-containing protein [Propionicicella superfundia]
MTAASTSSGWQPATGTATGGELASRMRAVAAKVSSVLGLRTAGWWVFALAAVLLMGGAGLGWAELTYAGLFCLVLGAIALTFTIGRPRYAVRVSLEQPHVVVGQRAGGSVEIVNRTRRFSLPSRMDIPVAAERASFAVPLLQAGRGFRAEFDVPTDRRAVIEVGPAQSIQGDPFGLAGRSAEWTDVLELYVHPRTVSLPARQAGFVHDLEGQATSFVTNSDMSFHALREYEPGDDRRHVHWKSSARTGRLMVRQFEETRQSRVCVAIDVSESSYATRDDFELAISVGASVALQAFREDNPLALITGTELIPVLSAMRTLDEMCRIEPAASGSPLDVVEVVLDYEAAASVVVWITGGRVPQRTVRKASTKFDADVRVVAVRVDERAALSVRTIANVTYIRLADLEDLPRAMRRAAQ